MRALDPDPVKVRSALVECLWQARANLQWISQAVLHTGLPSEDAEEVSDHADEAEEALLGPLSLTNPRFDEAERAELRRRARRRALRGPKKAVLAALEDTLTLLRDDGPAFVGILCVEQTLSASDAEGAQADLFDAADSVEAAIAVLDPARFGRELRATRDADERIALASRQEQVEVRRDQVRTTNELMENLSKAGRKLQALQAEDPQSAEALSELLGAVTEQNVLSVVQELVERAGMTETEARGIVGNALVGRGSA